MLSFFRKRAQSAPPVEPLVINAETPNLPATFAGFGGAAAFPSTLKIGVHVYTVELSEDLVRIEGKYGSDENMLGGIPHQTREIKVSLKSGVHEAAQMLLGCALKAMVDEHDMRWRDAEKIAQALLQLTTDNPSIIPILNVLTADLVMLHRFHADPTQVWNVPRAKL